MLLIFITFLSFLQTEPDPLVNYRWKNRILVLNAPENSESLNKQLRWIMETKNEFVDRDMILVILQNDGGEINGTKCSKEAFRFLSNKYQRDGDFALYLIGKDGGVKMRKGTPVNPIEIYQLIDTMPMRQREMKQN
jgi:hypothetical protein